jgi:hypothetical protein
MLISIASLSFSQISVDFNSALSLPFSLKKAGSKIIYDKVEKDYYDFHAYGFDNRLMVKKELEKISLALGISHHLGNKFNINEIEDSLNYELSYATANVISLDPMIYFNKEKFNIGLGFISALYSSTEYSLVAEDKTSDKEIYSVEKLRTKFRFGFLAELNYTLYNNESFFIRTGFAYRHLNLKAKKSEIIHYEVDGKDKLSSLNTQNLETNYVKEIDPKANLDKNTPAEELSFNLPFSALLISISFEFKL